MRFRDLTDQVAHRLLVAGVALRVRSITDVGANHGCALAAEQLDRRLADPRCRAGDDRDLACEPVHAPLIAN